ncbi:uncharacterized protein LY79DRAFT_526836 [Colletotrichum navitas]|uniref:Uncharacterized protein n=1 Tax=Colletotrichum navitas TaxID=681940 RepID=A0AAD8PNM1_9PEZI|nr:uncharacterized protein LY79DRAFT_526836 [Colletotrichum navitas]KAK1572765.1 hypothetical protein LY79DRAFT_526836 [Colletotrichum navitas]
MSQRSAPSAATTTNGGSVAYQGTASMMGVYLQQNPMELPERLLLAAGTASRRTTSDSRRQAQQTLTAWDTQWHQAGQSS